MKGGNERQVSLSVKSDMSSIREALVQCREFWSMHAPEEACVAIELSVAEALNNIHEHAYGGREDQVIDIRSSASSGWIEVILEDRGATPPRSVTEFSGAETFDTDDLDGLPEGGFGLMLMHQQMDVIEYSHCDGRNQLMLRKSIR